MLPEYRAVSGLAVGGLLLGLASVLAFVHPTLWAMPVVAVVVCGLALRRLASEGTTLVGRRPALIGLAAALICGVSSPVQYYSFRYQMRADAIRAAREWFTALRENRPWAAHQLTLSPEGRWSLDDAGLVGKYTAEPERLKSYAKNDTIRLLLTLGKHCHVRHYENIGVVSTMGGQNVLDIYTVTVEHEGRRVTFFLRLVLVRTYNFATGNWEWRVSTADFVRAPPGEFGFEAARI